MLENSRKFEVVDPFGRAWDVEFRWHQNGITIRHADTVDVKYYISNDEERRELVVALPHPILTRLSQKLHRTITDPWCMMLAGLHVRHMISNWDDMERVLATATEQELASYADQIEKAEGEVRERAALYR